MPRYNAALSQTATFTVPAGFQLFEEDDIYGGTNPASGSTVQVDGAPVLLRGH